MTKAVLIVGGSIAGVQAALDLANSGLEVYLVERSSFLGNGVGTPQHLIASKFLEAIKHPNIQLLTQAEVTSLLFSPPTLRPCSGQALGGMKGGQGDFRVEVQQHPRYVDMAKCTACGECVSVCPVTVQRPSVVASQRLSERMDAKTPGCLDADRAIYKPDHAVPSIFAIEKRGPAPCKAACPAGVHVQGYVALIAQGKFAEALALIRETIPFPGICGRVCHHPCEAACRRGEHDEPIAIQYLKRFVADYEASQRLSSSASQRYDAMTLRRHDAKKVAVVGSGPAGLTAAYFLARQGYPITVFEALPVAGGMMAVGIPAYRLPRDILQSEIETIQDLGVEIRTSIAIGPNGDLSLDDLRRDYDAVFVAVGAHGSRRLNIAGEDLSGVIHGVDFLREVNLGREVAIGEKVVVVGGGDVAIDSAMVARRLGARQVTILYRRSREEMPAHPWEIEEAEEEGIAFRFLATPTRVLGQTCPEASRRNGQVTGLECLRLELGELDESGRRRPVPVPGSEFTVEADTVIVAIGQVLEVGDWSLEACPEPSRRVGDWKLGIGDWIAVDPLTLATDMPGIFAGGDAVTGPATVIEAIAAGKRAAESIARYLRGQDLAAGRLLERPDTSGIGYYTPPVVEPEARARMPKLSLAERADFAEINLGFSEMEAMAEAERCLSCAVCSECLECVKVCEPRAIDHAAQGERLVLDVGAVIWAGERGSKGAREKGSRGEREYWVEPEDVLGASATAAKVMADLASYRAFLPVPSFLSLPLVPSRIGVFVCRCGEEIGAVIDVDAVVSEIRGWPGVAFAEDLPFACHEEGAAAIRRAIVEADLDQVVLAACSCCSLDQVCDSCTYQRVRCKLQTSNVKRETSSVERQVGAGFEFVNIREQCAWVHADEPARATAKSRSLIASAVAKVRQGEARARSTVSLDRSVLVIGDGMAGAVCADALQAQGLRVFRSDAPPLAVSGSLGNFTAVVPAQGGQRELRVGAVVLTPEAELGVGSWRPALSLAEGLEVGRRGIFAPTSNIQYPISNPQVWGLATASRIATLLSKGWAVVEPIVAQVDPARCRACGTCQEICEFHAVRMCEDGRGVLVAQVDQAACLGCGTCAAHCPSGAITAGYSTDRQIEAMLSELVR
jgi:NADPH-dependent glutamate synthase beta subunit-like oxidoreductase/Pyruvate/2-oxoacid:ferredoxin oxidoreductase delta subunit